MLLFDIAKLFDVACEEVVKVHPDLIPHASELLAFARSHERRKVCLENVCDQVVKYETGAAKRWRPGQTKRDLKKGRFQLVAACAQLFMLAIKEQRDQQNWSEATKILRVNGDRNKNDMSKILVEVPPDQTRGA